MSIISLFYQTGISEDNNPSLPRVAILEVILAMRTNKSNPSRTGVAKFLLASPDHFDVSYRINPWMAPEVWHEDPAGNRAAARRAWSALAEALRSAGAILEVIPGAPGLPDMVFPANSAIVLDGRALLSRFRYTERRGEEAYFHSAYSTLQRAGVIDIVKQLPKGVYQEGAGDCMWDGARQCFWAGYGPRSCQESIGHIGEFYAKPVIGLQLTCGRYYHLDTCFCPLSAGEILFFPDAFSREAINTIRENVDADLLIEADQADAENLALNVVNIDRTLIMSAPTDRLRGILAERGYRCVALDLAPFMMSGGGAFCMTLRLDQQSKQLFEIAPTAEAALESCY